MSDTTSPDLRLVVKDNLAKSITSLLIKVATAALTYLMYVVLARSLGADAYGQFAFGLALATLLAVVAGLGQQTAVLRYFSEDSVAGTPGAAAASARMATALTLLGGLGVALVLVVAVAAWQASLGAGQPAGYLYATAPLLIGLAIAETASSVLRSQGSVWVALAPRDLLWRLLVPLVIAIAVAAGWHPGGSGALALTAALLIAALLVQAIVAQQRGLVIAPTLAGLSDYVRRRGVTSVWFLAALLLDAASINLDTILVGLFIDATSAGVYFNALRTAALMTLFSFAISLVIAPPVARHFHAGQMRHAQGVLAMAAWAGFGFSLVVFALFAAFGGQILSLFGEGFAEGYPLLLILGLGLLCDAAAGPTRTLTMMSGHERPYVLILASTSVIGIFLQVALIPVFGLLGAALLNALSRIVAQVCITWWCVARIGLDPSIFGVLRVNRLADRMPA